MDHVFEFSRTTGYQNLSQEEYSPLLGIFLILLRFLPSLTTTCVVREPKKLIEIFCLLKWPSSKLYR